MPLVGRLFFTDHFTHFSTFLPDTEILSYHFSVYLLVVIAFAVVLTVVYVLHKHWMLSNIYGEAFSATAIQLLSLDSFWTGIILLSGLFFYDIFWVFFTPVMVTVAKSFDAPIKVVFPKDFGQLGLAGFFRTPPRGVQFTMLGLGDIVIPGGFRLTGETSTKARG